MDPASILLVCSGLAAIIWIWKSYMTPHILTKIPTPPEWPLFGHIFKIHPTKAFLTFKEWSQQLGDIFVVRLPRERCVVINSPSLIDEMMIERGSDFAGRPLSWRAAALTEGYKDIIFHLQPNEEWKKLKKIFLQAIHQFGTGGDKLESVTNDVIQEMLQNVQQFEGNPFDLKEHLNDAVCNITYILVTGHNLPQGSKELGLPKTLNFSVFKVLENTPSGQLLDALPFLRFFGHPLFKWINIAVKSRSELTMQMSSLKENFDMENEDRCVLDSFFRAQQTEKTVDGKPFLTEKLFEMLVLDIFTGAIGTTTSTLYSIVYFLKCNQDVQKKAQQDIINVLGARRPSLNDRASLPYVVALINESFRYGTALPFALLHVAIKDTQLGQYKIPKGTMILPNIHAANHDERYWPDPSKFDPKRFLDDGGNILPNSHPIMKRPLAFGGGPRICPGQAVGTARLFLIVTSILQKFTIQPEDECHQQDVNFDDFECNIVHFPKEFKVKLIPAKN